MQMRLFHLLLPSIIHSVAVNIFRNTRYLPSKISYVDASNSLEQWAESSASSSISDTIGNIVQQIGSDGDGIRAAVYLSERWFTTKSKAYKACKYGQVTLNGRKIYASMTLTLGDTLEIDFTEPIAEEVPMDEIVQGEITASNNLQRLLNFTSHILDVRRNPPLHILYEDNNLAVVFKPSGLHSMKWTGTMKKQLFALDDILPLVLKPPDIILQGDSNISDSMSRPLPCHRLDARVSGCLIVAKTQRAIADLSKQFEQRIVEKEYSAVLAGNLTEILIKDSYNSKQPLFQWIDSPAVELGTHKSQKGNISVPVDGLDAYTEFRILDISPCSVYGALTTVVLCPKTGRRHQLRRHCAVLGCPIVGDDLYHDAAYLSLDERQKAIQAVSVGKKKSNENNSDEDDGDSDDSEYSRATNESVGSALYDKGVNHASDSAVYNDKSLQVKDAASISNLTSLVAAKGVRKGVGIFLVCTALEFYHPINTISGIPPKDLTDLIQSNSLDINGFCANTEVDTNQQGLIDRIRMRVECEENPRFARLKEKARKGYEWKLSQ